MLIQFLSLITNANCLCQGLITIPITLQGTIQVRDYTGYALQGIQVYVKYHNNSQIIGSGITDGDGLVNIIGYENTCLQMIDLTAQTTFGKNNIIKTLDISKINVYNYTINFHRELIFSKKDSQNFELSVIYVNFGVDIQDKYIWVPFLEEKNSSCKCIYLGVNHKIGQKDNNISVTAQTDENGSKTVYFLLPKGQSFNDIDYNGQKNGYWSSDCSYWYQGQFIDKKEVPKINIPKFSNYEENIYIYLDIAVIKFIFQAIVQNQYGQLINDALMIISIEDVSSNQQEQQKKQTKSYSSGQLWIEMLYQPLSKISIKESIMAKGYATQHLQFEQTFNFSQRVEQYIHDFGVITLYKSNDKVQIIITGRIIAQFYCKGLLKWKGLQGVEIQVQLVKSKHVKNNMIINTESILNSQQVSLNDFINNKFKTNILQQTKWKNRIFAHYNGKTEDNNERPKKYDGQKDDPKKEKKAQAIVKENVEKKDQKKNEKKQNKKDERKNKNYIYSDEDGYFFFRKTSKRDSILEFQFKKRKYLRKNMYISIQSLNRQPDDSYYGYLQKIRMIRSYLEKKAKCPSTDQVDDED